MEEDFPRNLLEFEARFSGEEACIAYLVGLRWPSGFQCPRCEHPGGWSTGRGLWMCGRCGHQTSVTAGTIFQDTRTPLRVWFRAMWWVVSQKNGASALGLQRELGLGSYRTAWTWLHKLRRAMVVPGRDQLSGRVEVDETFVGGEEEGARGRATERKALVVIAAEEDGPGIGRIRMRRIPDASAASLHPFIEEALAPSTVLHTDGWAAYRGLEGKGYVHEATPLTGKGSAAAAELLPRIHLVASLLKRWLLGTHQGAVSREHLDYYLDEFTFRFNRRTSASRGKLFYRLAQQAVVTPPIPYRDMISSPASSTEILDVVGT